MKNSKPLLLTLLFGLFSALTFAGGSGHHHDDTNLFSGQDTEAAAVVKQFHTAQEAGDKATVLKLLSEDVMIFEGGGVERSAQEYAGHHMASDMKFLAAMTISTIEHNVTVVGNMALSLSRSHLKGTYKNKEYDRDSMETMTLIKQNGQWRINHIHWSN